MTDKVAELTEKIYKEGIEKARNDAEQILENASKEADEIIALAEKQKMQILEDAQIEAADLTKKTMTDLQLSAQQFISNLKKQVTSIIMTAQTETPVQKTFEDVEFMQKMILTIIQNWNPQKTEEQELSILLPQKDEKALSDYFKSKAVQQLNKGIEIKYDSNINKGFKISPKNGRYIISFSDTDFENFFKNYLKDKTRKLLFETEQEQ